MSVKLDGTMMKNGNVARFEHVTSEEIERHTPIVRKMISLYDYGTALTYDEKFAAGLLGIAYAIESYDPRRDVKFSFWLAFQVDKTIRNEARAARRQLLRAPASLDEELDALDENALEIPEKREEERRRAALLDGVRNALERLDATSRRVVSALYLEGKTQREVAGELGRSQSWTSRLAAAALRAMRYELAKEGLA